MLIRVKFKVQITSQILRIVGYFVYFGKLLFVSEDCCLCPRSRNSLLDLVRDCDISSRPERVFWRVQSKISAWKLKREQEILYIVTNVITPRALFSPAYLLNLDQLEKRHSVRQHRKLNPALEPNMKWIGRPLAEIWPFEIFKIDRSVAGQSFIYFLHLSHILLRLRIGLLRPTYGVFSSF